jgi:hypothetical protein
MAAGWPGSTNEQFKWQRANGKRQMVWDFFRWQIANHLNFAICHLNFEFPFRTQKQL